MKEKLKEQVIKFLEDLKQVGSFYISAIEIDTYDELKLDGEILELRLTQLLTELKK